MSDNSRETLSSRIACGFLAAGVAGIFLLVAPFFSGSYWFGKATQAFWYFENAHLWISSTCLVAFMLGSAFGTRMFGTFRLDGKERSNVPMIVVSIVLFSAVVFWNLFN